MIYLNLIPAILIIAAYFLGRYIGRQSHDAELKRLRIDNSRLATMLDFTQAECEHVAGLLGEKVAGAHDPMGVCSTSVTEIHTDGPIWLRASLPDPHE